MVLEVSSYFLRMVDGPGAFQDIRATDGPGPLGFVEEHVTLGNKNGSQSDACLANLAVPSVVRVGSRVTRKVYSLSIPHRGGCQGGGCQGVEYHRT